MMWGRAARVNSLKPHWVSRMREVAGGGEGEVAAGGAAEEDDAAAVERQGGVVDGGERLLDHVLVRGGEPALRRLAVVDAHDDAAAGVG